MNNLLAQLKFAPEGGFRGLGTGPLTNPGTSGSPFTVFAKFLSTIIGVMTVVAVIWAVFSLITGAIAIISSAGDKQALESAKKKITTGIIGLIVVLLALTIIQLVGFVLGIQDILNLENLMRIITGTGNANGGGAFLPN